MEQSWGSFPLLHTDPLAGAWILSWQVLGPSNSEEEQERRKMEREKGVQTNQIQSHHLNLLFPSPKTFKDTTAKNISSISCKKKVTVYLQRRQTHLATKYQQWHTEGRGLNTLFFLWQTLAKELHLYHSTRKIPHSEHGLSKWRMLK